MFLDLIACYQRETLSKKPVPLPVIYRDQAVLISLQNSGDTSVRLVTGDLLAGPWVGSSGG